MKNKNITILIVALVVIVAGYFFFTKGDSTEIVMDNDNSTETISTSTSPVVVTPGTKPVVKPTPTTTTGSPASAYLKIGQRKLIDGVFVTPIHLTLDSRCPTDVKCIQAGTADINTLVQKGNLSQNIILSLNKPVVFSGKQLTLISVTPNKLSTRTLVEADYEFVVSVK